MKFKPNIKTVKAVCLIIIFSACLLLIYGLAVTFPHLIAVETGQMISEDEYYEKYHDPDWEYYGKYGKCYASLSKEGINTPSSETVGGLKFEYETQSKIRIFYGRRFYSLKKAYENGFLTEENLTALHLYHTEIFNYADKKEMNINFDIEPIYLYEYEVRTILYYYHIAYCDALNCEAIGDSWSIDCLYKKDGVYAGFVDCSDAVYLISDVTETVNGLNFAYPNARMMTIYNKGNIYPLINDAFEAGVLTSEMLEELHISFYQNYDKYVEAGNYYFNPRKRERENSK